MFVNAIKLCSGFTRPIYYGVKTYGSDTLHNGISTIIVLNEDGWFLTCKHVAKLMVKENYLNQVYPKLLIELSRKNESRKSKEERLRIKEDDVVLITNFFSVKEVGKPFSIKFIEHEYLDIAVGQLTGNEIQATNYPTFSRNDPEPGQSLCKLGFPFPEYDGFTFNADKDRIVIKKGGDFRATLFPLDGMMTRDLIDNQGKRTMFEMSSPGLRGQSGGPIFDSRGIVYGIQTATKLEDLDLDFVGDWRRGTKMVRIENQPMLALGIGVNSSAIKEFLNENKIRYNVE